MEKENIKEAKIKMKSVLARAKITFVCQIKCFFFKLIPMLPEDDRFRRLDVADSGEPSDPVRVSWASSKEPPHPAHSTATGVRNHSERVNMRLVWRSCTFTKQYLQ